MNIEQEADKIYDKITTDWAGSQMLFPFNNKKGNRFLLTVYKDDTRQAICDRLKLWYENEPIMTPIV